MEDVVKNNSVYQMVKEEGRVFVQTMPLVHAQIHDIINREKNHTPHRIRFKRISIKRKISGTLELSKRTTEKNVYSIDIITENFLTFGQNNSTKK